MMIETGTEAWVLPLRRAMIMQRNWCGYMQFERCDDRVSRRSVEGHALFEALKAATALELNRIVFDCDYYPLYQLVSRWWRPKQQKVTNLMDQLNLLGKSFIYFELNLHTPILLFLCEATPKCPHEGCGNELRIESCEKFLTPKFTEMTKQHLKEDSIPVTDKVYCPNPRCSTLMSTKEALRHPVLVYELGARACYNCHGNFCVYCRVPSMARKYDMCRVQKKKPNFTCGRIKA